MPANYSDWTADDWARMIEEEARRMRALIEAAVAGGGSPTTPPPSSDPGPTPSAGSDSGSGGAGDGSVSGGFLATFPGGPVGALLAAYVVWRLASGSSS